MGLFTIFASIAALAVGAGLGDMFRQDCEEIVDIYVSRSMWQYEHDTKCPYTKTLVCDECPNYMIRRDLYDDWAQDFYKYGLYPPYPKRTDIDRVYQPKK